MLGNGAYLWVVNPTRTSGTRRDLIAFDVSTGSGTVGGLAGSFVGLYKPYITASSNLANGDYQINVTQSRSTIPQTM